MIDSLCKRQREPYNKSNFLVRGTLVMYLDNECFIITKSPEYRLMQLSTFPIQPRKMLVVRLAQIFRHFVTHRVDTCAEFSFHYMAFENTPPRTGNETV